MRRAKIRPSINLSAASRRSVPASAAKAKDPAPSTPKAAGPKPGLRSATKPSTPQASDTQPIINKDVPKGSHAQQRQEQQKKQQQEEHEQVKDLQSENEQEPQQQQQQQQYQQHDQEKRQQRQLPPTDSTPSEDVSPSTLTQTVPVPQAEVLPSSQSKPTPESPSKTSSTVRRKRITAVPNLGQPRGRTGPSQPAKTTARAAAKASTPENEVEVERGGARGKVGETDGARPETGESEMGPPSHPPPIQRITAKSAPSTQTPTKEPIRPTPAPQDTPSQPPSQTNSAPTTLTTPRRPSVARSESTTDKRSQGSENIYEKKLRELRDRIDSETPSRRRRHYVKQKVQPPERSKMTMSDLIYFNPKTSPMKNTAVTKEKRFPRTIMTEHVVSANNSVNNSAHNSENEDEDKEKEEDVDPFAPQVKIGPDGSIILDSTSLVKDASPAKTLRLSEDDIVQEDSSHTTYSSFRQRTHTRAWSEKDTAKFYRALSAVGTDFSMIKAMFPKRTRQQIKNKFKREERYNRQLLDKAIRERQHFDMSLFNKEPSSDSELENRLKKKKNKEKSKSTAKGKSKERGKRRGRTKPTMDKDDNTDKDSDEESIVTETYSKDAGEEGAKDAAAGEVEGGATTNGTARPSDGSEDEIDMETILSHPTRSGRQPKMKVNFSAKEPEKRRRGGYHKVAPVDQEYASRRLERLNREREIVLARKEAAKRNFPPYTPGGLLPSAYSHPRNPSAGDASPRGVRQVNSSPHGSRAGASPGTRGISTITTPMGRFIVSVPQQPASPRPVGSPSPEISPSPGGLAKKGLRTHIFVISSPDGTQNVIHVPLKPDTTSSQDAGQPESPTPAQIPSTSGPKFHNPMSTPQIIVRTLRQNPQQTPTVMRQVVLPSAEGQASQSPTNSSGSQTPNAAVLNSPLGFATSQNQQVMAESSAQQNQHYHIGKRGSSQPLTLQSPGTNKVIVMSPHAQLQSSSSGAQITATSHSDLGDLESHAPCDSPNVLTQHNRHSPVYHQEQGLASEKNQKVSHMTSDMDTDWLLRDGTVGHEVDILTSDFVEETAETDEPFIPSANIGSSPLMRNRTDEEVMGHVTDEHLSAQDILDQMTYEEGVEGDVGANMEVALKEEIITQIASEMEVE